MSKFVVIANSDHPLYEELKTLDVHFIDPSSDEIFETKNFDYLECDYVFDFTLLPSKKKYPLLKALSIQFDAPLISDLTFHWAQRKFLKFDKLVGVISTVFPSPTDSFECYARDPKAIEASTELLSMINKKVVETKFLEFGFTYPRIVSMIINEAYFSLEEKMSDKESIDKAMKFGVNYPLGPFEWADKIGQKHIVKLLDELFFVHHDPRYKVSSLLRIEATV